MKIAHQKNHRRDHFPTSISNKKTAVSYMPVGVCVHVCVCVEWVVAVIKSSIWAELKAPLEESGRAGSRVRMIK